ncbi:MAG: hypothetical protein JO304_13150 [Solirubrobacterales bacterium]|nr:hypothetical protein [Solirubrobacterales bacterium]
MADTLQEKLDKARHLTYAERRLLTLRYGLEGGRPRTLAEVSQILGVPRESVRKMEHRATKKLGIHTSSPAGED